MSLSTIIITSCPKSDIMVCFVMKPILKEAKKLSIGGGKSGKYDAVKVPKENRIIFHCPRKGTLNFNNSKVTINRRFTPTMLKNKNNMYIKDKN